MLLRVGAWTNIENTKRSTGVILHYCTSSSGDLFLMPGARTVIDNKESKMAWQY